MADISIQFYALPEELQTLATEAVADFNLHVVAMRYPPFEAAEIGHEQLKRVFTESSSFHEIAFTLTPPALPANGRMEFIDKNPDQLSLQIGRQTKHGLEESCLSARTADSVALAAWRKIANRLKNRTKQGVTAINRESGVSASYKSIRYTQGAEALENAGVAMVPPQGPRGPRIILGMANETP